MYRGLKPGLIFSTLRQSPPACGYGGVHTHTVQRAWVALERGHGAAAITRGLCSVRACPQPAVDVQLRGR